MLWFADILDVHGAAIAWGLLIGIILLFWIVRQKFAKPVTNWLVLRIPFVGKLKRKILMTRFSRTMHSLLKSGVTVDQSLEHASTALNKYLLSTVPGGDYASYSKR